LSKKPLLSVIMSVYNAQNYLKDSIESILNQTYKNFEFIIINDGSSDNSLEIIEEYAKQDSRIKVINQKNKGLPFSLNRGIEMSSGEYIVRMDADDISLPYRFEKQLDFMQKNPEIGICGSSIIAFGEVKEAIKKFYKDDKMLKSELLFSTCFAHPTVFMRSSLFKEFNIKYNEEFVNSQDYELFSKMAKITKFANIQEPLLKYRVSKNSVTKLADSKNLRFNLLKKIIFENIKNLNLEIDKDELMLHFNLTVNHRIANIKDKKILLDYFEKILLANKKVKFYDEFSLKKVLGKRWLWYMYYKKDLAINKYLFYGLLGLKK